MGYRDTGKVYKLVFEDRPGLEVRMTAPSLGEFMTLTDIANIDVDNLSPGDVTKVNQLFDSFTDHLVSWNLEDKDGNPVPATPDGLRSRDMQFIYEMINAWMQNVAGIPGPKGPSVNGGEQFPAVQIPMEMLLPNPTR